MDTQQIDEKAVFNVARRIADAAARDEYLAQACGDDDPTIQRIRELLRIHEEKLSFLESPAADLPATTEKRPINERPGTIIGPYKLLQQIGEGGMGVVFMAEQTRPVQRTVALKIIKPGMDTRQVIARFEAERQAVAMMDHPNIAKVLDAGTTDSGRPYFVMELVKGVPITRYCDEKHLPLRARLELFMPVCQAVQHAHQKGIIHRDIKPTNVLVAEYDNHAVPKVIDFGVAKATAQKLTERTMFTEFGQLIGTFEYMSPEQAKLNQLDIDTRSDIYSLGVLLYELLTGETPFDRKRLHSAAFDEMLRIVREEEPPKPSTKLSSNDTLPSVAANRHSEPARLSREVRGELDWIVMKALEKDRARRYDTANDLAADLRRYLSDETVHACPPSAIYRFGKFARKNKATLITSGLVAFCLLAGTVVSTWQAIRAKQARHEAEVARADEMLLRQSAEAREKVTKARALFNDGNFAAAEKLIEEIPSAAFGGVANEVGEMIYTLANWNAGEHRWNKAAAEFEILLYGSTSGGSLDIGWDHETMSYLEYAPLLIELGDSAGYEKLRETAVGKLGNSDNSAIAERALMVNLLLPPSATQMAALERIAKVVASSDPDSGKFAPWAYVVLALHEYRRGNYTETIKRCEQCLGYPNDSPPRSARAHVLMAMAYFRLNQHNKARAELAECRETIESRFKNKLGKGSYKSGLWHDWLIDRILLREAETLSSAALPVKNDVEPTSRKAGVDDSPGKVMPSAIDKSI